MTYTAHKRLWLATDGTTVVEDGDERAAVLIATPGSELSDEDARRYGLVKDEASAEAKARTAPPSTKQVKSPTEHKAK